jgi:hypothetical protein
MKEEEQFYMANAASFRSDFYIQLLMKGRNGLVKEFIVDTRSHFQLEGVEFVPKEYTFVEPKKDAVGLICGELPSHIRAFCYDIAEEITSLLPRTKDTNAAVAYINDQDHLHVTFCHTSHPKELIPNARLNYPKDLSFLKEIASQIAPFELRFVRVLLTDSGAIILLLESNDGSIDQLRFRAKKTFSCLGRWPKRQTEIIHITLARILDPSIDHQVLAQVHLKCQEITDRIHRKTMFSSSSSSSVASPSSSVICNPLLPLEPVLQGKNTFKMEAFWYVNETHHFSAAGPRQVFLFNGGEQHF